MYSGLLQCLYFGESTIGSRFHCSVLYYDNELTIYSSTAAYHAEKVNPLRESKAPAYSFGLKTGLVQMKSTTPSPNSYTLPSLIGSNIVGKRSNAAYSMTGRSKIGSFHEDLRKVRWRELLKLFSKIYTYVYG